MKNQQEIEKMLVEVQEKIQKVNTNLEADVLHRLDLVRLKNRKKVLLAKYNILLEVLR